MVAKKGDGPAHGGAEPGFGNSSLAADESKLDVPYESLARNHDAVAIADPAAGWLERDLLGSYYACIEEIGRRVRAGEPVHPLFRSTRRAGP